MRDAFPCPAPWDPQVPLESRVGMSSSFQSRWEQVRAGRVRILWLVLGALLMVSALPIGLYHRQVLQLSQNKLVDTERVQQTDLTRSLAQEIQLFESNLTQQLTSERQILALTGLNENVEDPAAEPKVTRLLENFVESNRNTFIYLTAVGKSGKGTSASQGNFRAEQDPFVARRCGGRLRLASSRRFLSTAAILWHLHRKAGRPLSSRFR